MSKGSGSEQPQQSAVENVTVIDGNLSINNINQNIYSGNPELGLGTTFTHEDDRNRRDLLKVVKEEVAGRLQQSLHKAALINLHKESQPEQVSPPWGVDVIIGQQTSYLLSPSTEIIEVFKQKEVAGKLLILGAPGSGKTTTQLELAQALITDAENDDSEPIPVLFNLSSWKDNNQTITEWLVAELVLKYGVRVDIGRKLVESCQLLLLLDGLDELESKRQERCVQAINQLLRQNRLHYLVVSSRLEEYESYDTKLQFNGAICLKPLAKAQIYQHLVNVEYPELWQGIQDDPSLLDLAKSPLLLSIMILAYKGISFQEWQELNSPRERFEYLLNVYIRRMLKRNIKNLWYAKAKEPTPEQTKRWLAWLAKRLKEQSQTEFFIEKMQPTWLQTQPQKQLYRTAVRLIVGLNVGLFTGLLTGLITGLFAGLFTGLLAGLLAGLIAWMKLGLFAGWFSELHEEIKPVESLKWSWVNLRKGLLTGLHNGLRRGILAGLISGLFAGLFFGALDGLFLGLTVYWIWGIVHGLISGLIDGLNGPDIDIKNRTLPNQGIWNSAVNAVIIGLLICLIQGLIWWLIIKLLIIGLGLDLRLGLVESLKSGLIAGLIGGLGSGLKLGMIGSSNQAPSRACIQHFTLRVILRWNNYIPWNYSRFLNYATERIFLQKVGGRYIFIHRLLLEHFAALEVD